MPSAYPPQLNDCVVSWSEQFPLLAPVFASDAPLSVFQNPYPGIGMALAMVAPEYERRSSPRSRRVRLLAVSQDGRFMARLSAKLYSEVEDLEYFWRHCASILAYASKQPLPVPNHWALEAPMDSLESLTSIKSWKFVHDTNPGQTLSAMLGRSLGLETIVDHGDPTVRDRDIQERLSRQFSEVVRTFLANALDPGMLSLLVARPRLSFSTLHRLMSLAMLKDDNGRRYMEFAIKTESLAVIDLAAREDGKAVCEAIFGGHSLPQLLKQDFDMDPGIHRRTLLHGIAPTQSGKSNPVLANLPMSSDSFLASLPVLKLLPYERWPRTHERWCDFFGVASELHILDIEDGLKQSLLFWLMNEKVVESSSSYYLYMLLDYAKALCDAAKNLAGIALELKEAIAISVNFMENHRYHCPEELLDSEDIGPTVVLVSQISRIDINILSKSLFEKTPSIPNDFDCAHFVITPLHNINMCMEHGVAASQCFRAPETAVYYGAVACALYGVSYLSGAPLGSIGCAYDGSDLNAPEVGVFECKGINNRMSVDLESLSAALAMRFSQPDQLSNFVVYTEAVSRYRVLAGASR